MKNDWYYQEQDYEMQFMTICMILAQKKLNGEENWNTVSITDLFKSKENKASEEEITKLAEEFFKKGFDSFLESCKEGERRAQAEWPVGRNY